LASTSAYRRTLLARLGVDFSIQAPGVDETPRPGERAPELVRRLARAKAEQVAARHPGAWVIGSDQAAVLRGDAGEEEIIGKPGSAEKCALQLRRASGRSLTFLTAVAVAPADGGALIEFLDTTRVDFRVLDEATVDRYVARESPLDCAGGFRSEGLGIALCETIHSEDPSALIGLPLIRLAAALRDAGFAVP
jgi:septum formation protein